MNSIYSIELKLRKMHSDFSILNLSIFISILTLLLYLLVSTSVGVNMIIFGVNNTSIIGSILGAKIEFDDINYIYILNIILFLSLNPLVLLSYRKIIDRSDSRIIAPLEVRFSYFLNVVYSNIITFHLVLTVFFVIYVTRSYRSGDYDLYDQTYFIDILFIVLIFLSFYLSFLKSEIGKIINFR